MTTVQQADGDRPEVSQGYPHTLDRGPKGRSSKTLAQNSTHIHQSNEIHFEELRAPLTKVVLNVIATPISGNSLPSEVAAQF